jgi:hypothetical protein
MFRNNFGSKSLILPAKLSAVMLALAGILVVQGCNTYRMMPSHGGGKRFDEEQRAVASVARKAIADINVAELAGHKINISVESIAANGGGTVQLPGVTNVSGGYNEGDTVSGTVVTQKGWNFNATYNANTNASPTVFATDQDLKYFDVCLQMKLRHEGIITPDPNAEYMLYVIVDVFGTNRSKLDDFIAWTDTLAATCELTYYAVNLRTNKLVFSARRSAAQATYVERSIFGFAAYRIERQLGKVQPSPMPIVSNDAGQYPVRVIVRGEPQLSDLWSYQKNVNVQNASTPSPQIYLFDQKLQEADSYTQAGNFDAAQRIVTEITNKAPQYPGLDAVNARLQQAKAAQQNRNK